MPVIVVSLLAMLIVVLQLHVYRLHWRRGLTYSAKFSTREATEGDVVFLHEELTNSKILPMPWVFVQMRLPLGLNVPHTDQLSKVPIGFGSLFAIRAYTAIRRRREIACAARGVYMLRNVQIRAADLLHLNEFSDTTQQTGELIVYPKILERAPQIAAIIKHLNQMILSRRTINPDPFEFKGIREYQPTDGLRAINFKATAKAQQLMSNIFSPTDAVKLTIVLNLEHNPNAPAELYEQSIRLVATLAQHYAERGVQIGFARNGRDATTSEPIVLAGGTGAAHFHRLMECLARAGAGLWCAPMAEYIDRLVDRSQMLLFVSVYSGEDLMDAFTRLLRRGITARMIVPYFGELDCAAVENVLLWDAGK